MFRLLSQVSSSGDASTLTSIGAVMLATTLIVQALVKPYVSNVPAIKRIPIIFYTIAVALLLTLFANKVLHTLAGSSIWSLLWQSLISVLGAAGIYHLPGATQAIEDTTTPTSSPPPPPAAPAMKMAAMVLLGLCSIFLTGCPSSTSPTTQPSAITSLALQGETAATIFNLVSAARDQGAVIQAEINTAKPLVDAYLAARARAEKQIAANADPATTASLIAQANAAWLKAAPYIISLQSKPATRPAK